MPSIHDILAGPNLPLYSSPVRGGTNTSDPVWTLVEKWTPWRDFTIENLTAMYASVLNAPWKDNLPNDVTAGFDQVIRDELSLTIFLAKYIWPAVNLALPQARSILRLGPEQLYLGTGSWCQQGRKVPDWGLALDQSGLSTGKFDNLLPGDTKLSAKWTPDMRHTNC
ncbi:hypothetical protein E4U13_007548 [Claviceps humidiphila]|uniref:Uncharacterized protein n=1 Tax=Claviceps humidiphila TaxID=1294629 RepID=A0A9P7TRW9_9HYPO|nr:hypothetical protein E4U13_007548 [Claviceps humidiphila]